MIKLKNNQELDPLFSIQEPLLNEMTNLLSNYNAFRNKKHILELI